MATSTACLSFAAVSGRRVATGNTTIAHARVPRKAPRNARRKRTSAVAVSSGWTPVGGWSASRPTVPATGPSVPGHLRMSSTHAPYARRRLAKSWHPLSSGTAFRCESAFARSKGWHCRSAVFATAPSISRQVKPMTHLGRRRVSGRFTWKPGPSVARLRSPPVADTPAPKPPAPRPRRESSRALPAERYRRYCHAIAIHLQRWFFLFRIGAHWTNFQASTHSPAWP